MPGVSPRPRKHAVDRVTRNSLVDKCQENGWLAKGGYPWQDDPYLEDYPYAFFETDSLDCLRDFFRYGNWAIRQGIVYRGLAFIQQVDGGDEWWTLKRVGSAGEASDWLAFESWSFCEATEDAHRFSDAITSMIAASSEECSRLDYRLPLLDEPWKYGESEDPTRDGGCAGCKLLQSRCGCYRITVCERSDRPGAVLEIADEGTSNIVHVDDSCESVVKAAYRSADLVAAMIASSTGVPTRQKANRAGRGATGLDTASSRACISAEAINSAGIDPRKADRQRS